MTGAGRGGFGNSLFVVVLAVPAVPAVLATARLTPTGRPNAEISRYTIRGSCGAVSRFCYCFCEVESAKYEV